MVPRPDVRAAVKLGLLAAVGAAAYSVLRVPLNRTPTNLASLAELAEKTHLNFPQSAKVMDGSICHCWEDYAYARLRISPGDVENFFAQPPFYGHTSSNDPGIIQPSIAPLDLPERWGVPQIRRSLSASGGDLYGQGKAQVLVDLDNPEKPVLLILWQHD